MSSTNNGLKVCTFNAKCDELDYKCCIKDACYENKCGRAGKIPDSLVAAMIAVTILPSKADVYNIQNVRNDIVVEHLVKEIARVKDITDELNTDNCTALDQAYVLDIACKLNSFSGLCQDGVALKDILGSCKICNLDYVDTSGSVSANSDHGSKQITLNLLKYKGLSEYNAYFYGSCLTLIKKSLCICPETHEIPYVDSLVLFFEYNDKRLINVNVNLGDMVLHSFEALGCKREKVEHVINFLNKYKDCGAIIMNGSFGDIDYDTRQLLFSGDGRLPDIAQRLMANGVSESPVPSDFPCDQNDPVYEVMEFLLRTCNAETIPYSWLLQYLRLKWSKKCNLYKLVCRDSSKCGKSCRGLCGAKSRGRSRSRSRSRPKCPKDCNQKCCKGINYNDSKGPSNYNNRGSNNNDNHNHNRGSNNHDNHNRGSNYNDNRNSNYNENKRVADFPDIPLPDFIKIPGFNRSHLRNVMRKTDKGQSYSNDYNNGKEQDKKDNECNKPACVMAKKCCCFPKSKRVIDDTCKINYKTCNHCDSSKCDIRCKEPYECDCDTSKHRVNVDTCQDLCKKFNSCCNTCSNGKKSQDKNLVCPKDSCENFKYCDTLTVLKKELCLYNALNKVEDVNNRYTGFYDHFNRCNDCKYPRGMFQAWAMCEEYEKPRKTSRVIDNNSELMALDHFLVSDCLKNNIMSASLSDLCIEKCGRSVNSFLCAKDPKHFNAIRKTPFVTQGSSNVNGGTLSIGGLSLVPDNNQFVFEYGGSVVRSFFTHRVYCVKFEFPHLKKGCEVDCGESLHGLGLTTLWSVLCKFGCDSVKIDVFEKFGLDTHPYFRDFFWKSFPRRFTTTDKGNTDLVEKLADKFGPFENSLLSIQKRHNITEEEFYKHLLCVFSNMDNRDRFILTIAFMESLYRTNNMKHLLECDGVYLLNDKSLVMNLFNFLSKMFDDSGKLQNFLAHQGQLGSLLTKCCSKNKSCNLLNDATYCKVAPLIEVLSFSLKENCLLMEILSRHATRSLSFNDSPACCSLAELQDPKSLNRAIKCFLKSLCLDSMNEKLTYIVKDLLCGANPKFVISELVDEVSADKVITLLFGLINVSICDFLKKNYD